jgi:hypothetical protein
MALGFTWCRGLRILATTWVAGEVLRVVRRAHRPSSTAHLKRRALCDKALALNRVVAEGLPDYVYNKM